jgi:hypothetical protein
MKSLCRMKTKNSPNFPVTRLCLCTGASCDQAAKLPSSVGSGMVGVAPQCSEWTPPRGMVRNLGSGPGFAADSYVARMAT